MQWFDLSVFCPVDGTCIFYLSRLEYGPLLLLRGAMGACAALGGGPKGAHLTTPGVDFVSAHICSPVSIPPAWLACPCSAPPRWTADPASCSHPTAKFLAAVQCLCGWCSPLMTAPPPHHQPLARAQVDWRGFAADCVPQ